MPNKPRMLAPKLVIPQEEFACPVCEKTFVQKRPWQKYCSQACQSKWWFTTHPRVRQPIMPADRLRQSKRKH